MKAAALIIEILGMESRGFGVSEEMDVSAKEAELSGQMTLGTELADQEAVDRI